MFFRTLKTVTRGLQNIFQNPIYLLTGFTFTAIILDATTKLAKASPPLVVNCPTGGYLAEQLNQYWRQFDCETYGPFTYAYLPILGGKFHEGQLASIELASQALNGSYPYCNGTNPYLILENNLVYSTVENVQLNCDGRISNKSYIGCYYEINSTSTSVVENTMINFPINCEGNVTVWGSDANQLGLYTELGNSTQCNIQNDSTIVCERDITEALVGYYDSNYFSFNHTTDGNISVSMKTTNYYNNHSCCAVRIYGLADAYLSDVIVNSTYGFAINADFLEMAILGNETAECTDILNLTGVIYNNLGNMQFTIIGYDPIGNELVQTSSSYPDACNVPTVLTQIGRNGFFSSSTGGSAGTSSSAEDNARLFLILLGSIGGGIVISAITLAACYEFKLYKRIKLCGHRQNEDAIPLDIRSDENALVRASM